MKSVSYGMRGLVASAPSMHGVAGVIRRSAVNLEFSWAGDFFVLSYYFLIR